MPVLNILTLAGAKMGLDPNASNDRIVLLRFLNEAAQELYTQFDPPGSLMEQVFKVNGDQTISMPSYVGPLRGIRELFSQQAWHVNKMRPRYNQFNWQDMWKNWRLRNVQALQATVTNQSHGIITVPQVETPNVIVTLTGPTVNSSQVSETVILNATSVQTVNVFLDYVAVKKNIVNQYDVTLSDVDGKVLTTIPNTELEAKYQIVDVSSFPWLNSTSSTLDNYLEILYKKKLLYLSNDADEFPAFDYDHVLVNKMMQLWMEEQGKAEEAALYDAKASRTAARIKSDQEAETEDVVSLVANPHDMLLQRIGTGLRRRYGYLRRYS
jgi:hypothetical protein